MKKELGTSPAVRSWLAFAVLCGILSGCASGYKAFYRQSADATPEAIAANRVAPAPTIPMVERAQQGDNQKIIGAYAKRGYVVIGYSQFNSGAQESEGAAIRQGQEVGADLVLILNPRYTGSVTTSVPITTPTTTTSYSNGSATAYGAGGMVTAFGSGTTTTYGTNTTYIPMTINRLDYGAVYFAKWRFPLGLFAYDLSDSERQELQSNKGVAVRVVVDGSPAFEADILVGDLITAIDGVAILNAKTFNDLLRERRGKRVSFSIVRLGRMIEKSVQLNA